MSKSHAKFANGTTTRSARRNVNAVQRISDSVYPTVYENGEPTAFVIPIADYERMVIESAAREAVDRLERGQAEFIDAGQFALELAGERIAKARKAAGLTQKQLGDRLKLPQSQISRIERNPDHTTVRTIKRIAKALGVDVSALL